MSSNNVKIKVKFGTNEVEIESPLDSIHDAVDVIPNIIKNLGSNVKMVEDVRTGLTEHIGGIGTRSQIDMPEIKIEKVDSMSDIVVKMFKNSWGRQPRKLSDVRQALDTYGLSYPKQSVAVTLLRLAKNGKLRRYKGSDGDFLYIAANALVGDEHLVASDVVPVNVLEEH